MRPSTRTFLILSIPTCSLIGAGIWMSLFGLVGEALGREWRNFAKAVGIPEYEDSMTHYHLEQRFASHAGLTREQVHSIIPRKYFGDSTVKGNTLKEEYAIMWGIWGKDVSIEYRKDRKGNWRVRRVSVGIPSQLNDLFNLALIICLGCILTLVNLAVALLFGHRIHFPVTLAILLAAVFASLPSLTRWICTLQAARASIHDVTDSVQFLLSLRSLPDLPSRYVRLLVRYTLYTVYFLPQVSFGLVPAVVVYYLRARDKVPGIGSLILCLVLAIGHASLACEMKVGIVYPLTNASRPLCLTTALVWNAISMIAAGWLTKRSRPKKNSGLNEQLEAIPG